MTNGRQKRPILNIRTKYYSTFLRLFKRLEGLKIPNQIKKDKNSLNGTLFLYLSMLQLD